MTWLEHSQGIRHALERFWVGFRNSVRKSLEERMKLSTEELNAHLEIISAHISPEYIHSFEDEEQRILASIRRASEPAAIHIQTEWGTTAQDTAVVPKRKVKRRSSGPYQLEAPKETETIIKDQENMTGADNKEEENNPPRRITVTKRAFDVLRLMYPENPDETGQSVGWDSFVHAMSDMGFTAHNASGSAVEFRNESFEHDNGQTVRGKIIFHKPHSVVKIDPVMLRSMRTRMAKWFGWGRSRFLQAEFIANWRRWCLPVKPTPWIRVWLGLTLQR